MQIIYTKTNKDTIFIQSLRGLHYFQKWTGNISKEEEIVKFVLKSAFFTRDFGFFRTFAVLHNNDIKSFRRASVNARHTEWAFYIPTIHFR